MHGLPQHRLVRKRDEIRAPQAHGNAPRRLAVPPQAHGDRFAERQQHALRIYLRPDIGGQCCGITVALVRLRLRQQLLAAPAVCRVPQCQSRLIQIVQHQLRVCLRQLADRVDADAVEPALRGRPEHKQLPHRQRPELLRHLLREQRVDLVRLFKLPCHFGQQLIGGDADIHRKAQLLADTRAQQLRRRDRRAIKPLRAAQVGPRLVDGILLHDRREFPQQGNKAPRGLYIQRIVRRHELQPRTFLLRQKDLLACFHAALFRWNALGQNDAVPFCTLPGHGGGNVAQVLLFAQHPHAVSRRPRQERAVHIHMKDHPGHPYTTRKSVQRCVRTV